MAEKSQFSPGTSAAWSKIRRNGNDDLPVERNAVRIIRTVRSSDERNIENATNDSNRIKPAQTKITKLTYEAKKSANTPTIKKTIRPHPTGKSLKAPPTTPETSPLNRTEAKRKRTSTASTSSSNRSRINSTIKIAIEQDKKDLKNKSKETNKTDVIQREFSRKKLERFNDIAEINDLLSKINNITDEIEETDQANEEFPNKNYELNPNDHRIEENVVNKQIVTNQLLHEGNDTTAKLSNPTTSAVEQMKRNIPITPTSQRSKTDLNLLAQKPNLIKRKSPLQTARSKSSSNLNTDPIEPKKKNYNPEEARKFMEEQKKKRATVEKSEKAKKAAAKIDREEIKKRLEDLRKNTLKILDKNVKKAKKREKSRSPRRLSPTKNKKESCMIKKGADAAAVPLEEAAIKSSITVVKNTQSREQQQQKPLLSNNNNSKKIGILRKPDTEENALLLSPLKGLNTNKENLIDEIVLKISNPPTSRSLNAKNNEINERISASNIPKEVGVAADLSPHFDNDESPKKNFENSEICKKEQKNIQEQKCNKAVETDDLQLIVPDVKLKTKVSVREKSIQVGPSKTKNDDVPYWLKPTPVQIYPYNIITAVRKKIQALTNPVVTTKKYDHTSDNGGHRLQQTQEAPIFDWDRENKLNRRKISTQDFYTINNQNEPSSTVVKGTSTEQVNSTFTASYTPIKSTYSNQDDKSKASSKQENSTANESNKNQSKTSQKSSSVLESNFSSISIHLPESNTNSEISSFRTESNRYIPALSSTKLPKKKPLPNSKEDDTTISSSVFSSPEKRVSSKRNDKNEHENAINDKGTTKELSPLSVENISKLQIKSRTLQVSNNGNYENNNKENRGNSSSSSSSTDAKRKTPQKDKTLEEFEELLEDFNKSLSQVIEVNEQMKTAFIAPKSPNRLNIEIKSKKIPSLTSLQSKPEEYSSDFEEPLTTNEIHTKSNENSSGISSKRINDGIDAGAFDKRKNATRASTSSIAATEASEESIPTEFSNDTTTRQHKGNDNKNVAIQFNSPPGKVIPHNSINSNQIMIPSRNSSKSSQENLNSREEITNSKALNSIEKTESKKSQNSNDTGNLAISVATMNSKQNDSSNNVRVPSGKEEYTQVNFFQSHVNVSRGDFLLYQNLNEETGSERAPPAYTKPESSKNHTGINSSFGSSEFYAIFNQSDVELSVVSQAGSLSEGTLNYSSIGLYEQLLQAENIKSDHLSALLKMREKALLDRTRGQIAWLEVQKEKYKAKGLTPQISAIKKKQRAILLKMEKERDEIKKLLQLKSNDQEKTKTKFNQSPRTLSQPPPLPALPSLSDLTRRKSFSSSMVATSSNNNNSSTSNGGMKAIVKGQELRPNHNLEIILQKREQKLKERRAHVERLIKWHQKLDKEEQEVLQLEEMLFEYNSQILTAAEHSPSSSSSKNELKKQQRRLEEIDNSLKELQSISSRSDDTDEKNTNVQTTGQKLNKLWRRLTGQKNEKFQPTMIYKLKKKDLEDLYEEAKMTVLKDFDQGQEMKQLLEETSKLDKTLNSNKSTQQNTESNDECFIPCLNLDFSFGRSDVEKSSSSINSQINKLLHSDDKEHSKSVSISESSAGSVQENIVPSIELISTEMNHISIHIPGLITDSKESDKTLQFIVTDINQEDYKTSEQNSLRVISDDSKTKSNDNIQTEINTNQTIANSEFSDKIISKENNSKATLSKSSDAEKVDTVADIPSLSYDSNHSLENSSKHKSKNEEISLLEEIVKNADDDTVVTLNENHLLSEQQRSSVIVSHISNEIIENNHSINMTEDQQQTSLAVVQSMIEEEKSQDQYSESFPSYKSNSNESQSDIDCPKTAESISNNFTHHTDTIAENNSTSEGTTARSIESIISDNSSIKTDFLKNANIEEIFGNDSLSESDVTFIDDITIPKFETTADDSKFNISAEVITSSAKQQQKNEHADLTGTELKKSYQNGTEVNTTELEKRLIDLDDSLKELHHTFERALSPEKSPTSSRSRSPSSQNIPDEEKENIPINHNLNVSSNAIKQDYKNMIVSNGTAENSNVLMPDIISEVEIRRRQQQILFEGDLKQLEHAMPYVFLREIPNKPPPPYVPPAHGSPMTTIFPSELRIEEITFRRVKELYEEMIKSGDQAATATTTPKSPSIMDENITNIYERIILDICKEMMQDLQSTFNHSNPETYKNVLALYNPPNRLMCLQDYIYKRIRKFLAMDKKNTNRINYVTGIGHRKTDPVYEILIQELYEEEPKWTNFDLEEYEIRNTIVDEIFNDLIKVTLDEIFHVHKVRKLSNY